MIGIQIYTAEVYNSITAIVLSRVVCAIFLLEYENHIKTVRHVLLIKGKLY